jgi:hypothetical protein
MNGVKIADQIHLTVIVNSGTAELDEHQHEGADHQAEVEGRVTATACGANPPTITIGVTTPTTVNVQSAQLRHGGTALRSRRDRLERGGWPRLSGIHLLGWLDGRDYERRDDIRRRELRGAAGSGATHRSGVATYGWETTSA